MVGAHVIGTGSARRGQELLDGLDLDQFVNYKETTALESAINLVFDCVGGKALEQCLKVVKKDGLVVGINTFDCKDVAARHGVRGMFFIFSMNAEKLTKITELLEEGVIRPVADSVFPLEQAADAFEQAAAGHNHGRMVVSVP